MMSTDGTKESMATISTIITVIMVKEADAKRAFYQKMWTIIVNDDLHGETDKMLNDVLSLFFIEFILFCFV